MKKIIFFSILLLSAIAVTTGTTITTTIQIQPAYSQAEHCSADPRLGFRESCVTPGKDPSVQRCFEGECTPPREITHQEAGKLIGRTHQACAQGFAECTVTSPRDR
jgi:hypothetical protein